MEVRRKNRLKRHLDSTVFHTLLLCAIGLVAILASRYEYRWDWTENSRNTLSEASRTLLSQLDGPVYVSVFARENKLLRSHLSELLTRYRRHKPDFSFRFINPDAQPARVRELGISSDGELLIEFQDRSETVRVANEQNLTNALQRLATPAQRWLVFLSGHGERSPNGKANHDLGEFGAELRKKGYQVVRLDLTETASLPDNTRVLVIAGPQVDLLPGEVKLIQNYLKGGGNLLWLVDPAEIHGLSPLAAQLGVRFLPGVVVDTTTRALGIADPAFALIPEFPDHPITRGFDLLCLFPQAAALELEENKGWQGQPFLSTLARTWNETGPLEGTIRPDEEQGERAGPLTIGAALVGSDEDGNSPGQRVVVVGDGDFLANAYLGNGGNLDLGFRIIRWLAADDQFIRIAAKTAPGQELALSDMEAAIIGLGFFLGLPVVYLLSGAVIWVRRRRG